jgi:phage terminase large subunit-like protein
MKHRALFFLTILLAVLMSSYTALQYIDDVLAGRQIVCKYVRFAIERHINDLKRAKAKDPEFPYYFDEAQAKRIIDFKQQLRHTKGEWANPRKHDTRIRLEPWQQFKDWVLFGWRREGGYRRFTRAYIEVGRKNGKTTDAAATANYCFLMDRPHEIGPEIYCIATKKDQAKYAWEDAERQIQKQPFLRKLIRTYKQSSTIVIPGTAAKFKPLGKDSHTEDALNPHFVLVDEYHAHRDNSMVEVMESAIGAREQPLIYIITTAGFDKNSACYQEERSLAVQILERSIDPIPENYFCLIYTLDEEDDWTDPNVWIKANPNLGISVRWEYLEKRIQLALLSPSKQNKIITKNLNIWTQSETRWIKDDVWKLCGSSIVEKAFTGHKCYAGMDLSATQDITAVVYCFPPEKKKGKYRFIYRFFIPENNLIDRERRDKVPYTYWIEKGYIIPTTGDAIDYDFIEDQILIDSKQFKIQEIAYDPWKAQEIVNHLQEVGFTMVPIFQRYSGMALPTDTFEKKMLAKEIDHGDNPVMNWMVSCTEVKSDRQGNIMPMKPQRDRTGKRIDGVVASIMALYRAVIHKEKRSVYEDRGLRSL